MVKIIDGTMLRSMVLAGSALVEANRAGVDSLNVFPVPDGDTGTNMTLTLQATCRELGNCTTDDMATIAATVSRGALKGARGNSGVILSQLLRGFCARASQEEALTAAALAECFVGAADMAYKALMKPREGTILTVARSLGTEAVRSAPRFEDDPLGLMREVLLAGEETLAKTPDMLPVLKQAGVVDAGGKGLLYLVEGFCRALGGEAFEGISAPVEKTVTAPVARIVDLAEIEFGYCSEVTIVHLHKDVGEAHVQKLRDGLEAFADSVAVVSDEESVKVHAHSETPYKVLSLAMELGEITDIKIDNMRQQNRELMAASQAANAPNRPLSIVAVAVGEGLRTLFRDLLVDELITGGQTMNPAIEDITAAIRASGGENVLILPNNPNIILAAQQAALLMEDRKVEVIPSRSMSHGIAAMLAYNPEASLDENAEAMTQAVQKVGDGQVTYAVRATTIGDLDVHEGDIIGLANGKLVEAGRDLDGVVLSLLGHLVKDDSEMITLFFGEEVDEDAAAALSERIAEAYPGCDCQVVPGGQPLYYYFISVE